jgi:single stranded DNA-binding protein
MAYFQRLQIMGVTGEAPTFKIVSSGPLARFSVCVTEWWRDKQGESKKIDTWFRCSAFGGVGESVMKQVDKGTWIFLEGRVRMRLVNGKERMTVNVDQFRKLEPRERNHSDAMPAYEDESQEDRAP